MLAVSAVASSMSNQGYGGANARPMAPQGRARMSIYAAQRMLERGARAEMSSASTALREQRLELLMRRAYAMIRALSRLRAEDADAGPAPVALAERFAIAAAGNWAYRFSYRGAADGGWTVRQTLRAGEGADALSMSLTGGTGALRIDAGGGDDAVSVAADAIRALRGGSGNDSLAFVGGAVGLVDAGSGRDALSISAAVARRVSGGAGGDAISFAGGLVGAIDGGAGGDAIAAAADAVGAVDGGAGRDAISISATAVGVVDGGAGGDAISVNAGELWRAYGGAGDDALSVIAGRLGAVDGGAGADAITVTAGAAGVISGGAGNDSLTLTGGSFGAIDGGSGDDSILLSARDAALELRRGSGADLLAITSVGALALRVDESLARSADQIDIRREDGRLILDFGGGDSLTVQGVENAGAVFLNVGGQVVALSEGRAAAGLDVLA